MCGLKLRTGQCHAHKILAAVRQRERQVVCGKPGQSQQGQRGPRAQQGTPALADQQEYEHDQHQQRQRKAQGRVGVPAQAGNYGKCQRRPAFGALNEPQGRQSNCRPAHHHQHGRHRQPAQSHVPGRERGHQAGQQRSGNWQVQSARAAIHQRREQRAKNCTGKAGSQQSRAKQHNKRYFKIG